MSEAEFDRFLDHPPDAWRYEVQQLKYQTSRLAADAERAIDSLPDPPQPRDKLGLLAMGEENEIDEGPDETFRGDDMPSQGHGDLEQHREMREYARIIAWQMPLLASRPSLLLAR